MPYRILQIGLGPIGQAVTRVLGQRARAKIIAGIDLNPALVGRDLGEVCQQPTINATISDSLPSVLAQHDIDIAIVTTHSQASVVEQQIQPLQRPEFLSLPPAKNYCIPSTRNLT